MIDWTEFDATNVLALPLHRWVERARYQVPEGFSGDLRSLVYSNGTEHGFATERAEMVMELGPMLTRVLFAGIRSLMEENDPALESYLGALAAGDHDEIVRIENEAAKEAGQ